MKIKSYDLKPSTVSTHEANEQHLFEMIAESYQSKDLIMSSQLARKHRLKQTISCVTVKKNPIVLEVGCGAGFTARYLQGWYRNYVGVDYSKNLINYARTHNLFSGVAFESMNVKDFKSKTLFDVILMVGVLHHVDDIPMVLRHTVGQLTPGGWLIANEPQPGNPFIRLARLLRKRLDLKYSNHQCELSAEELSSFFSQVGLTHLTIMPQGLLSTPFAEMVMQPQFIMTHLSRCACLIDSVLERALGPWLRFATWNLILAGRKPTIA